MKLQSVYQPVILDSEIAELRLLFESRYGILIDKPTEAIADKLAEHMVGSDLRSTSDLLARLRQRPSESATLLDFLLPCETSFFRVPSAFAALEKRIIPELRTSKRTENPRVLRIWSAGCATGQEAYSIAMSVCEALNDDTGGWNVHIVANDIRRDALALGERGLYSRSDIKSVPARFLSKYFSRIGDHFMVKPRIRNLVTFTTTNLANPDFLGRFEVIFCVGVLPHFSAARRTALVERLHLYLQPGGFLFLGQNEKLPRSAVTFTSEENLACSCYRRPAAMSANAGQ
ncbi:MAG TPA: protein-glutamate O-methyltransferase CheR [Terriglobales bacterium]|nr:protein-glutamate O-methyltransferase CheR [Terriglobales bacterium]